MYGARIARVPTPSTWKHSPVKSRDTVVVIGAILILAVAGFTILADGNSAIAAGDDLVVGIAASGVTPYVHGAIEAAATAGAATAFLTCGRADPDAELVVRLETGPAVLAGPTRPQARPPTKLVLNMIPTGAIAPTARRRATRVRVH